MVRNTYQIIHENEIRNISISLLKQDNTKFIPSSSSTFEVFDSSNNSIINETSVEISSNIITANINTTVTGVIGEYYIIWKIIDSYGHTYYHKTILNVTSII
jgi:hypothetical protein